MATTVHIVSTGARTPLGLNAAGSAAAYRAGINAMGTHPFMIDHLGDPMPAAIDQVLDPGKMGPERLVALAESALREATAFLADLSGVRLRTPLFLGLPEIRPGFSQQDADAVLFGISHIEGLPLGFSEVRGLTQGHAAGLSALALATEQILRGSCEACLVGGVESYFHPDTMEWLDDNLQLATADARSAFVPGEGAAFCVLMADQLCRRLGLSTTASIRSVSTGTETKLIKTSDICLGEGLTATVRGAIERLPTNEQMIDDVFCDINGERYRGEEWGFVCLRLPEYFKAPTAYQSPASLWGDTGAASGTLFAMLAHQAMEREATSYTRTLLWASSERGSRAAAVLQTSTASRTATGGGAYA